MSWYWRDQDRYQSEIKSWESHDFSLDSEKLSMNGQVVFEGDITYGNDTYAFQILYPEGYPSIAPSVKCTNKKNLKHQTPFSQTICYHEEWLDYGYISGEEIYQQLVRYVKGLNEGFQKGQESNHVEPDYFSSSSEKPAVLLAPEDVLGEFEGNSGFFKINVRFNEDVVQASLVRLSGLKEKKAHITAHELFSDGERHTGYLVNAKTAPPLFEHTDDLVKWANEHTGHPDISILASGLSQSNSQLGPLVGIRYFRNGKPHFLLVSLEHTTTDEHKTMTRHHKPIIFSTEIYSENQLFKRVSHLHPLQSKHVAVIGVGAIGSPIALELTKAGVGELTLVDPDRVGMGNIVRHVATIEDVGVPKVYAVRNACKAHNPSIAINTKREWWGYVDETYVAKSLQGVDIVICCLGHTPTERYINDLVRRLEIPAVYAYASAGAISGRVFSVPGSGNGCYHCHQYALSEGRVPALRQPTHVSTFYDEGCASPTYVGSGIDTSSISMIASRHALQLLLKENTEAIEGTNSNHFVWYAENDAGNPEVHAAEVEPYVNCSYCEPLPDVRIGDIVPMARPISRAMTDLEEAMMENRGIEEAVSAFQEQLKLLEEKIFLYNKNDLYMFKGLELKVTTEGKRWMVEVSSSNEDVTEVEFDEFFGYEQVDGMLYPRYKYVAAGNAAKNDEEKEETNIQ